MARVPYVRPEDLPDGYGEYVVSQRPADTLPDEYAHLMAGGDVRNIYAALAHFPETLRTFRELLDELWDESGLGPYERELVILTVLRELEGAYAWHQHVRIALVEPEGPSADEIVAISRGRYDELDPAAAALTGAVADIVTGPAGMDDATYDALRERYDDTTIAGIATVASLYTFVARVAGALDVDIEDGEEFVGWELENL